MTDNMFDKFVSEKLRDHQSTVPAGLWERIELKKNDKPRGGFWWLSKAGLWGGLFIIVMSLAVGYYILYGTSDEQQPGNIATAKHNSTDKEVPQASQKNQLVSKEENITGQQSTLSIKETINAGITKPLDGKDGSIAGSATEVIATTKDNKITASAKEKKQNKNSGNAKLKTDLIPRRNSLFDNVGYQKKSGSLSVAMNLDGRIEGYQSLSLSKGITAYGTKQIGFSKNDLDLSKIKIAGIDCPPNGRQRRNDWYLEVYGSPEKTFKSVSGSSAFVQKKDSTESTQLGYTAGFRISKSITDNILFKTGLQYSQINEKFNLRTENERRITTVVTIRTITTAAGTDTTIRDTTTLTQIGYSTRTTYNRYRSIDVPLLLSYEFGNENLKFAVNGGVILNLRSFYSGETVNDSLHVVSLNSKSAPMYKSNIGVGIYAGFSIIKPVSLNTDLFLEPYFRYNLSNMTTSSGYTQKFNAAGVSFGIRYKLNRQRK